MTDDSNRYDVSVPSWRTASRTAAVAAGSEPGTLHGEAAGGIVAGGLGVRDGSGAGVGFGVLVGAAAWDGAAAVDVEVGVGEAIGSPTHAAAVSATVAIRSAPQRDRATAHA